MLEGMLKLNKNCSHETIRPSAKLTTIPHIAHILTSCCQQYIHTYNIIELQYLTFHGRHKLHPILVHVGGEDGEEFSEIGVILEGFHGDTSAVVVGGERFPGHPVQGSGGEEGEESTCSSSW